MSFITSLLIVAFVVAIFSFLRKKSTSPRKAIIVLKPKLGLLNLSGEKYEAELRQDRDALENVFADVQTKRKEEIQCDVLFVYGDLADTGAIEGYSKNLREIIRDSKAVVTVFATENKVDAYIIAAKDVGFGHANLVMTLERNGTSFQAFFKKLFQKMIEGYPMPVAWVDLAPQGPNGGGKETPGTIFSAELGQVLFQYSAD